MTALVNDPVRQCFLSNGHPKAAYDTFDQAFDQIAGAIGRDAQQTHVYQCPVGHGYHLAKNRRVTAPQ